MLFSRIHREKVTIQKMIEIYCTMNHSTNGSLCIECSELLGYAHKRLEYCPYSNDKPACNKCPIHCYRRDMREKVKKVMRFSGPKMIFRHPFLAIMHLVDKRKEPPTLKNLSKKRK